MEDESSKISEDADTVNEEVKLLLGDLLDEISDKPGNMLGGNEVDSLKTSAISKCKDLCSDVGEGGKVLEAVNADYKSSTRRIRSTSERNGENNSDETQVTRRKFGSDSEITPLLLRNIPLKQNELDVVIGKYVNKLIRDSICNAIKNVNVDGLYEEIVKDLSNRKSSSNADSIEDFVVEQRLDSNSISELVELEVEYKDGKESVGKEVDEFNQTILAGYLADLEDTISLEDSRSVGEESSNSVSLNASNDNIEINPIKSCKDISAEHNTTLNGSNTNLNNRDGNEKYSLTPPKDSMTEKVSACSDSAQLPDKHLFTQKNTVDDQNSVNTGIIVSTGDNKDISKINKASSTNVEKEYQNTAPTENVDLILISEEDESSLISVCSSVDSEHVVTMPDIGDNLPQQSSEEEKKVIWKVGYLHVKLPHKARGKTQLKAWKKRRVAIQPDEFVNDPSNPSLVLSIYGADSKKNIFWQTVTGKKAVVYRSSSRSHRYAFTVAEDGHPVVHLSAENESVTQEWMAAIRSVLWPPSPFMQLEKMMSGREFEISLIDNDFAYHAGLLGMYGYLTITTTKLILLHPQEGYVIQEWYLNTVDKFQLVSQSKPEDAHKILAMTTCSDSSTGKGEILLFCNEAVTLLQSLAATIHQVLTYRSKQEGGRYKKELDEVAEWLTAPTQDSLSDEHYRVPTRQVKSLLDIPNFIFAKSLSPVASAIYPAPDSEVLEPLAASKDNRKMASQDSGISTGTSSDDFLNCSVTSFVVGGGPMTGKSSDSEMSDNYTPPRSPLLPKEIGYTTSENKPKAASKT